MQVKIPVQTMADLAGDYNAGDYKVNMVSWRLTSTSKMLTG